ncbi:hypothetical protein ACFYKT_16590 [Cytobacillus sp. FJAT-53684]|uniref:Uncharacterized protein n=1 Tax=Cytobacillus mangrovibacter TaxID=3299024 RepID=A0ABW6K1B1_9BACI
MEVTVNEQAKRFWMARKFPDNGKHEWKPVVGHEIKVGEFSFFVAALPNNILNVSEVTTGYKVFEVPLTIVDLIVTDTKEQTMEFYRDYVGERLKRIIQKEPTLKQQLASVQAKQKELLGEMPKIEDFDETLITAPLGPIN